MVYYSIDDLVCGSFVSGDIIFVRSGWVYLPNSAGTLRGAGLGADYWSSRGDDAANAYSLYFGATGANPSSGPSIRWHALPLRCLSTVLDI